MVSVAATALCFAARGNNSTSSKNTIDSSANVTNPPDNSSATNPSLADTAYSKNYADTTKKDSSKMKK
jgi:hypothetical protein